jgi:uncharacterized protein with ParB-like and HNH nuclease domain
MMVAKEISFVDFLKENQEKKLLIPIYQRAYEWTTKKDKEVYKLWEDIENIELEDTNSTHFLNSIVYIEDEKNKHFINIIDGQQRITTLSILFIAIRDRLNNLFKENEKILKKDKDNQEVNSNLEDIKIEIEKISDNFLERKWQKGENKVRLSLSNKNKDREVYNHFINNNSISQPISNIIKTHKYFLNTKKVKSFSFDELKVLLQKIERINIVKVTLELEKDNPQTVFSSLNGGGLKLKDTDLIKNSIFMKIEREKQEELHSKFWEKLEYMPNEKNSDKEFAKFMQHFLTMKLGRVVTTNSIYEEFVNKYLKQVEADNDYEKVKTILIEMLEYKDIFLDLKNHKLYSKDSILPYFEIEAYYPFLMLLKGHNSPLFTKVSKVIESFYVRRFVYALPAGATKNIFASACKDKELKIDDTILNTFTNFLNAKEKNLRFPSDEEFKGSFLIKNLYEDKSKLTKAILFVLEQSNNPSLELDFKGVEVEHILPQNDYHNLSHCWKEHLSNDEYDKQLHSMGNLTLLTKEDNASIKDACFENKKEVYLESSLQLNEYLVDVDEWNSESIKSHANYLVDLALDRWKSLE